jgi:hypothetical protein
MYNGRMNEAVTLLPRSVIEQENLDRVQSQTRSPLSRRLVLAGGGAAAVLAVLGGCKDGADKPENDGHGRTIIDYQEGVENDFPASPTFNAWEISFAPSALISEETGLWEVHVSGREEAALEVRERTVLPKKNVETHMIIGSRFAERYSVTITKPDLTGLVTITYCPNYTDNPSHELRTDLPVFVHEEGRLQIVSQSNLGEPLYKRLSDFHLISSLGTKDMRRIDIVPLINTPDQEGIEVGVDEEKDIKVTGFDRDEYLAEEKLERDLRRATWEATLREVYEGENTLTKQAYEAMASLVVNYNGFLTGDAQLDTSDTVIASPFDYLLNSEYYPDLTKYFEVASAPEVSVYEVVDEIHKILSDDTRYEIFLERFKKLSDANFKVWDGNAHKVVSHTQKEGICHLLLQCNELVRPILHYNRDDQLHDLLESSEFESSGDSTPGPRES